MSALLDRIAFWWRSRRLNQDLRRALEARRIGRAARQHAARKGVTTKFHHRMEGLKR